MPQVVQPDTLDVSLSQRAAPPVADGVLVERLLVHAGEEPGAPQALLDVLGEHLDECVGAVDGAFGVVLL